MFIREIKKNIIKNGKSYRYSQLRLVESVRTSNGPRQRIVLNLGTLDVDPADYKALANLIESLATNSPQLPLVPCNSKLETIARHFAEVLVRQRLQQARAPEQEPRAEEEPKFVEVDVNSIIATNGRKIGCEHIALRYFEELGFFEVLDECGFSPEQKNFAAAQVCSRLIHPSSERESARWLRETSGLDELLDCDFSKFSDNTLHRIADQLLEVKESLEEQLSQTTADLFSLKNQVILYDLTNTYFESPKAGSEKAKYGRSKERRSDCPQLTLALIVDERGFPKCSQILKGGVSEPHTLWDILEQLDEQGAGTQPRTVIIDAGIATKENLEQLRGDKRFEYVAVNREQLDTTALFGDAPSRTLELSRGKTLEVRIARQEHETFLLCHSKEREAKEQAIFSGRQQRFEQALKELNASLAKPRKAPEYAKVMERIGRLKERYKIGHLYDIEVTHAEGRATAVVWRLARHRVREPGEYVLRTSRKDLDDDQISTLHRTLTMIESSFRWLKSDLGLRPNYHQFDHRMEAHIFISVLAYYVLAPVLNRLEWGGQSVSTKEEKDAKKDWSMPHGWRSVVEAMDTHVRVTTTYRCKDKKTMDIRTTLEPTAKQYEIYRRLKVNPRPLKNKISMNT